MKLQRILFIMFTLLSCIPILIMTVFSGYSLSTVNQEKLISSYFYSLEQESVILTLKFSSIENSAVSMFSDQKLMSIMATHDFNVTSSDPTFRNELSGIISRYFHREGLVSDILFLPSGGGYYSYNNNKINDPIEFIINNGIDHYNSSKIKWAGVRGNIFDDSTNYFIASSTLDISPYAKDKTNAFLRVYFVIDMNFLNTGISPENSGISTYAYNNHGILFFNSNGDYEHYKSIWDFPSEVSAKIVNNNNNNNNVFQSIYINGERYVLFLTQNNENSYYLLRTVPYDYYNTANIQILCGLLIVTILFFIIGLIASYLLAGWLNKPLSKLIDSIKDNSLDAPVYIKSSKLHPTEYNYLYEKFNNMLLEMNKLHNERISSEQTLSESKLTMLKYQINPHFINNTLSSIRIKLLEYGITDVAEMISIFASLIRSSLNNPPVIPLSAELESLLNYISLMQLRHKNNINVVLNVPTELYNNKLQSMLLQPIIENSLRHGLGKKLAQESKDALIKISAEKTEEFMIIEIYDNGIGFENSEKKLVLSKEKTGNKKNHIGLYNINERIKLMHGNKYGIEIESKKDCYTVIRLKLPDITD